MIFHSQHREVIYENTVLLLDPEVLHRKNVEMQQKRLKCNNKDDSFWSRGGKNERQSKPEED